MSGRWTDTGIGGCAVGLHWLTAADGEDSGDENSDEKQPADIDYSGSAASAGVNAKSSMGEIKSHEEKPGFKFEYHF